MPLGADVSLEELAQKTEFYSGADLQSLCKEVALQKKYIYVCVSLCVRTYIYV